MIRSRKYIAFRQGRRTHSRRADLTMKVVLCILLIGFVATTILAQGPECPVLNVTGPAGIPAPSSTWTFNLTVSGNLEGLTYNWTTSFGKIVSGQGTRSIEFKLDQINGSSLTATVDVIGLPEGCVSSASETVSLHDDSPKAVLIKEIAGSARNIGSSTIERIRKIADEFINNQIYTVEYFPASVSSEAAHKRSNEAGVWISKKLGSKAGQVINVWTRTPGKASLTRIYRVPPGAENPVW